MSRSTRWLAVGIAAAALAMLAIGEGALLGFPHSADEYVYLYQARTLLAGRVTNPPIPDDVFQFVHVIAEPDRTYGKYPPGWPAVLALGEAVGAPLLVNPLLSALGLALAALIARRALGERVAAFGVALLATSPFLLLHGGSFYPHPLVALLTMALALCVWRYAEDPRAGWLAGAAAALGGLVLTRPFDAAIVGVVAAPFVLVPVLRRPGRGARHVLVALPALLALVGLFLLYNAATTGDPFALGYARSDAADRPALVALRYWTPTLRRAREYALFGFPIALFPVAAWSLRRRVPRGPLLFTVALVAAFWLAYAAYPIVSPPRLGPRYLYPTHWLVGLVLAGSVVAVVRRRWQVPLVATVAAVQLVTTALLAVELHTILRADTALYGAGRALGHALHGGRAVVVVSGPSGSAPPQDLARNDLAFQQPVLFARERVRGHTDWQRLGMADRRVYTWDGIGGLPVLWTADPEAPVQQVVALGARAALLRRDDAAGAAPWLAVFGSNDCAPAPYLALLWQGLFPPDRLSDVQRPYDVRFGPCPGFAAVERVDDVAIPAALPRRLALASTFRSFLTVREAGDYLFTLSGDERALLHVAGSEVAEARDGATRSAALRLPVGTYAVAVSHYTLWRPPALALRIDGPRFELSAAAPRDSLFRPRLPPSALQR